MEVTLDMRGKRNSNICSKDVKKFYSQKPKAPAIVNDKVPVDVLVNDKVPVDALSPKKYPLYPVVNLNNVRLPQHRGKPLNIRFAKRRYQDRSNDKTRYKAGIRNNDNKKYKAGINKQTGGLLRELPGINSTSNTNCSLIGNDYNVMKAVDPETNSLSTPLITSACVENKPSTIPHSNSDVSPSMKPESKNVYSHDNIFSTPNLKSSKSLSANGTSSNSIGSNSAKKSTMEYTSKKENLYDNLLLVDDSENIPQIKDNEKELSSLKTSTIESNNDLIEKHNYLPSAPQSIPNSTQVCNNTPDSTSLQLPLKECDSISVTVTCATVPLTPKGSPGPPSLHNYGFSNSTPLQFSSNECGNNMMEVTCSLGSPQVNNSTPNSTPTRLPLTKYGCDELSYPTTPNCLATSFSAYDQLSVDLSASNNVHEESLDGFVESSLSSLDSLEDCLSDKTNDKVKNKGNSNKKLINKSNIKKTKCNSILNYFNVDSTEKKKCIGDDGVKMSEADTVKSKKKGVLTSSELNAMFDLPVSPHLQHSNSKGKHKATIAKKAVKTNKMEQMYIDIGQKNFGPVECQTCGMVYAKSQDDDEAMHAKFHQKVIKKLHIKKGWRNERVIQEFHDGRIITISSGDHPSHLKKLSEVKEVVDAELGFVTAQSSHPNAEQQAFLFLISTKIVGCAIAVSINEAYPVIPHSDGHVSGSISRSPASSWCCSTDPVPALCGISRVWVFSHNRRQNIATRLVNCIRFNYLYGCVIPKEKIAFSDPTPDGRSFAEKYIGKGEILVFR